MNAVDLGDTNSRNHLSGSAGSVSGGVGVVLLKGLSVLLNVLHTVSLPSSIASIAGCVAINHLLLSKGEELSLLDGVVSFNGSGG